MRNGNEKRGNEEVGRRHIAFYSANCVTAVIKCDGIVNVHPAIIERSSILYSFQQRGICMQWHCTMVGKLVLHFWQLVSLL